MGVNGRGVLSDAAKKIIRDGHVAGDSCIEIMRDLAGAGHPPVSRQAIHWYKRDPDVVAAITAANERAQRYRIASKVNRIAGYDRLLSRLEALIESRAEAHDDEDIPGGDTGLVAEDVKAIGAGENAHEVKIYRADMAVVDAILKVKKQAAQELGQWTEQISGPNGGPLEIVNLTPEQQIRRAELLAGLKSDDEAVGEEE